jgi:uncharacterized repeat protein (TIGR02543 family)
MLLIFILSLTAGCYVENQVTFIYGVDPDKDRIQVRLDDFSFPQPVEYEGYEFVGWFRGDEKINNLAQILIDNDTSEIRARYKLKIYRVVTESYGAPSFDYQSLVSHGQNLILPNIIRQGYIFGGWYQDPNFEIKWTNEDIVTEDLVIYAKWIEPKIEFGDDKMHQLLINLGYDKNRDNYISTFEAAEIESLSLRNKGIESLSGFDRMINLKYLDVGGNLIKTLAPLVPLTNLKEIVVDNNLLPTSENIYTDQNELAILDQFQIKEVKVRLPQFQRLMPQVKSPLTLKYQWRTLLVVISEVDTIKNGTPIKYKLNSEELAIAQEYARSFKTMLNNYQKDVDFVVDLHITRQVFKGDVKTSFEKNTTQFWYWAELVPEVKEMMTLYDSVIVMNFIPGESHYFGLGYFDLENNIGSASVDLSIILRNYNNLYFIDDYLTNVTLLERLKNNYIDIGQWVLLHEFLHGLEYYGTSVLGLNLWDLHNSDLLYGKDKERFFRYYFLRDYDWHYGYINGMKHPTNPQIITIDERVWANPPTARNRS